MSTFGIENYDVREIQDMISSSLAVYKLPTGEIKDLLKFDSTFTLNPYDDKTLTIDNKKVVSKILNNSRKRKPFSFFSDKSGDRKPELIQINKAEYIVNCISFYAGRILSCDHLEPPKTFYINFIIFAESTSVIYNHMNYVAVSIISNRVKIIFGDQSHTLKNHSLYILGFVLLSVELQFILTVKLILNLKVHLCILLNLDLNPLNLEVYILLLL